MPSPGSTMCNRRTGGAGSGPSTPSKACLVIALGIVFILSDTSPGQTPALLRGPYLQSGSPTAITICWRTDVSSPSAVAWREWGTATWSQVGPSGATTEHAVTLSGLTPATRYEYRIGDGTAWLNASFPDDFTTAPPVGSAPPTRIWVLGDSGTASQYAGAVRNTFEALSGSRSADLWLMLGDNAIPAGTDLQYQTALFDIYPEMLSRRVLWPAYGNHDAVSADADTQTGPYFDIFHLPVAGEAGGVPSGTEAWYSFDWANVHFICLDSTESDRSANGPMMTWLQADATATNQDWTIAFWHHPPYSKGIHDSDIEQGMIDMRSVALPILEAAGVDLVLCGHNHLYERSILLDGHYGPSWSFDRSAHAIDPGFGRISGSGAYRKPTLGPAPHQGTVYVVAGSSGHVTPGPLGHPVMVASYLRAGSLVIDVNGPQLDCRFLDYEARVFDHFTIEKSGAQALIWDHAALGPQSGWRIEDSGTDLGSAWRNPGFDDSGWSVGRGIMGFGEAAITRPVASGPPGAVHPTTYFRGHFTLEGPASEVERLRLAIGYDDGFVAWLNGTEAARRNMPPGPPSYTTLAPGNVEYWWAPYSLLELSPHIPALVPGDNVLAIEVHQATPTSDDLLLTVELNYEGFFSQLGIEAQGTAGIAALGTALDLLRVNDSAGGVGRSFLLHVGESFVLSLEQPIWNMVPAEFAIFGMIGIPGPNDAWTGSGQEVLCFAPAFSSNAPAGHFVLADSSGTLPHAWITATSAPWSLTLPGGLAQPRTLTLQGLIRETPTTLASTNAIILKVVP